MGGAGAGAGLHRLGRIGGGGDVNGGRGEDEGDGGELGGGETAGGRAGDGDEQLLASVVDYGGGGGG